MEFTTQLELHSQTTRLVDCVSVRDGDRVKDGTLTLSDALFQETCTRAFAEIASIDYNSERS